MTATIFRHTGHWDYQSRQNRALRFVESYGSEVQTDLRISYSATKYYAPTCTFFDTTNVAYHGAPEIKAWMQSLFSSFDKIEFIGRSFLVIEEQGETASPAYTVNAEFMATYYVRGDPEPVSIPRLFVFTIGSSLSDDGFDGLQFLNVKLFWDTHPVKEKMKKSIADSGKAQTASTV